MIIHRLFFIAFYCSIFLINGIASASSQEDQPVIPNEWTVEEAVLFAIANSPDTAITKQRINAARASVQQASAAFYPQVDIGASYGQTNNPMYSFGNILNQGAFDASIDFNDPGRTDNLNMSATLNYRFYNGGRDEAGLRAAEAGETASKYKLAAVHSQLGFQVVRTFFTIIHAEETLQARQSAIEAIAASIHVARARYEAGDLLKADLLNLEVHQSRAQENLIQARHSLNLAKKGFLNLLGLKKGPVRLKTDCDIEQLVPQSTSFENRPELKRLDAAIEAAESLVRKAYSGYYPTADAFAGYQVDKGFELDGTGNSWIAGVKINYNLFNGHQTSSEIALSNSILAEKKERKRKMSLAFDFEVEQARLFLEQAEQRLQVTEKMVEQAEESARLSRERFKEGIVLSSDLIDVEDWLTDALVRKTGACTSRRIAIADLRRAVGLPQFRAPGESEASANKQMPSANERGKE